MACKKKEKIMLINSQPQQSDNSKEFYAFIEHLMWSKGSCCYATANRYCNEGLRLKTAYEESLKDAI